MARECRILGQGWKNVYVLVLHGPEPQEHRSVGLSKLEIITNGIQFWFRIWKFCIY